jgi:hypothetical protein
MGDLIIKDLAAGSSPGNLRENRLKANKLNSTNERKSEVAGFVVNGEESYCVW